MKYTIEIKDQTGRVEMVSAMGNTVHIAVKAALTHAASPPPVGLGMRKPQPVGILTVD